jgi:hypothetical protein
VVIRLVVLLIAYSVQEPTDIDVLEVVAISLVILTVQLGRDFRIKLGAVGNTLDNGDGTA